MIEMYPLLLNEFNKSGLISTFFRTKIRQRIFNVDLLKVLALNDSCGLTTKRTSFQLIIIDKIVLRQILRNVNQKTSAFQAIIHLRKPLFIEKSQLSAIRTAIVRPIRLDADLVIIG